MHPEDFDATFSKLAPAGYYLALHLGFYAPAEERNTFPGHWVDHYTHSGLAPLDPLMRWCHAHSGVARWSTVALPDPMRVIPAYHAYGFVFGAVVSIPRSDDRPRRSFGLFARADRELREEELAELHAALMELHVDDQEILTAAQAEALRLLSQGRRHKEIAHLLGISVSAVKARLKSATARLEARTPVEAASIAAVKGLL